MIRSLRHCQAHNPTQQHLLLILLALVLAHSTSASSTPPIIQQVIKDAGLVSAELCGHGMSPDEQQQVAQMLPDRRTTPAGLNVNVSVVADRLLIAVMGLNASDWVANATNVAEEFLSKYPSITGVLIFQPTTLKSSTDALIVAPGSVIYIRDLLHHRNHNRFIPLGTPAGVVFNSLITEVRISTLTAATSGSISRWTYPLRDCRLSTDASTWWFTYLHARSVNNTMVGLMMTVVLKQCPYRYGDASTVDKGRLEKECYVANMICSPSWQSSSSHEDNVKGSWSAKRIRRNGRTSDEETIVIARCRCRSGSYFPAADLSWPGFPIAEIENNATDRCIPCPAHCDTCSNPGVCMARRDAYLQTTVVCIQVGCMVITIVLALVVFKQRKCKTIASGMWRILETILLGIFLLYSTVLFGLFPPSIPQCLIEPWLREVGFIVCYGAIILKLYRHLIEFRTRKAHRWVVKDTDLLKYLMIMTLSVLVYMAAYTSMTLHFVEESYNVLSAKKTTYGLHYWTCKATWWDYVTEVGEATILVFGIQFSYGSRNAKTQFHERRFLCCSVIFELLISGLYYVSRALILPGLHPNVILVVQTLRIQLTVTPLLLLVFVPKLWYQQKQVRSLAQEYSCKLPVDAFKDVNAHGPLTGNNSDVEMAEVALADMSPDDIRAELKRLYMQLEIFKNKTICRDNPHISKRRGGRKAQHRRFSLQNLYGKHHREKKPPPTEETIEAEPSRTPEDSVCSVEGPSAVYSELPSTAPPPQHTSM